MFRVFVPAFSLTRSMYPMQIFARAREIKRKWNYPRDEAISKFEINPRPEKSNFNGITPAWTIPVKCRAEILTCAMSHFESFSSIIIRSNEKIVFLCRIIIF